MTKVDSRCRTVLGAKFNTSVIDYDSNIGGYTPAGFLNNPAFFDTSGGFNPNASFNNTFIRFTGATLLNSGANSFIVPHDDGLTLFIDGIGLVLNEPGPTSPVDTPFTVNAPSAGLYNFTLRYGECCGPPAVLAWTVNGAPPVVPEPSSVFLLGGGLFAVALYGRRLSN